MRLSRAQKRRVHQVTGALLGNQFKCGDLVRLQKINCRDDDWTGVVRSVRGPLVIVVPFSTSWLERRSVGDRKRIAQSDHYGTVTHAASDLRRL